MTRAQKVAAALGVFALLVIFVSALNRQFIVKTYSNLVLVNSEQFLPCEQLPEIEKVEQKYEENQELRIQLQQISPNLAVSVERDKAADIGLDTWQCPGKADILITVQSEEHRQNISQIVGNSFDGVPYRIINY